jgi:ParB family chromosome partitioning protein
MEYAIVENIQREDLNAVEEAKSYKNLMNIYNYTQEEVGAALGKSRSYIANMLRILSLPVSIINLLESSKISVGHARALIGLEDPLEIAKAIILKNLSVRQTEAIVHRLRLEHKLSNVKQSNKSKKDVDTLNLETNLSFQTKFIIKIEQDKLGSSGKLIIKYNDLDELDKICEFIYSK